MGPPHTLSAPPPALSVAGDVAPVSNAYFALALEAAAGPSARAFLNEFLDPTLRVALDLRVAVDPAARTPLSATLLGRAWDTSAATAARRAGELRDLARAALPRHLTATPVDDPDAVAQRLTPLRGAAVDSAVITRRELIGLPSRPDAGVSYYYSAVPFHQPEADWAGVHAALAASPVPAVFSVAVMPVPVPARFTQTLLTLATFYGRLAQDGPGLAADPFAAEAEQAFKDYHRRLAGKAFALRIQVSAARRLPPGLVEAVAAAISPACDVRRPASVAERRLAEYNLGVVNFGMLTGRPEIWGRPDPPDPQLALLPVLGTTSDACCAFRFPVPAASGEPAARTQVAAGHQAPPQQNVPVIRLGRAFGTDRAITVPLRSLTGHTLVAGSAGSGKTTTTVALLRQLWAEHQVPFLVIEPGRGAVDGYRALAAEPGFERLEIITAGDEGGAPLRFNPFAVPAGVRVGEHTTSLLACFAAAFGLSGARRSGYADALSLTYLRAGLLAVERPGDAEGSWPTVADFVTALAEVTGPADSRARSLLLGAAGSVFLTSGPGGIARLLDHPVVLDLGALAPGEEPALLTALLLSAVAQHGQAVRGPSRELAHVTVLGEAHRLLARADGRRPGRRERARERAATVLAGTLAGSRRNGEGLILTEQFPCLLVPGAVKNTSLQVMHRLVAGDDQRYLGEVMGLDQAQRTSAARLRPGEALLRGDELGPPVQAEITAGPRPDPVPPRDGIPAPPGAEPSAAPPFAACALCRAPCAYRGAALSMLHDPRTVTDITVAALQVAPAESDTGLTTVLYDTVGRFATLPAAGPGRSDAAFCLFLHAHATSPLRTEPDWPASVARSLGIAAPPAPSD